MAAEVPGDLRQLTEVMTEIGRELCGLRVQLADLADLWGWEIRERFGLPKPVVFGRCWAYDRTGRICGRAATSVDPQRGYCVCRKHLRQES